MAKAPINIRSLARSHGTRAIEVLAGLMENGNVPLVRIAAANSLLDRGYGKPQADDEGREHLNITIRKILEIGAPSKPATNGKVIDHEPTNGESDGGHDDSEPER